MKTLAGVLLTSLFFATASGAEQAPPGKAPSTPDGLAVEVQTLRRELTALASELAAIRAAGASTLEARMVAAEAQLVHLTQALAAVEGRLAELGEAQSGAAEALESMQSSEGRAIHLTTYGAFVAEDTDRADSTFDAESFELVLSAQPHARLGLFAEVELERAASVGGERGGEVLLEQAWASYRLAPWASLRAGALLVPFGNVNVDHYAPARDVISKPLVSYVVAPSDWTDNGLGLSGSLVLGGEWSLRYDLVTVAGLDADVTALGTRAARQPFGSDNNNDKALAGRVAWKHGAGLELGMSGYRGRYDDEGRHLLAGWAVDALVAAGPFRLTGEYDRFVADRAAGESAVLAGWYVRTSFDLAERALRRGRHGQAFPEARLSLVGQYDEVDLAGPLAGGWEENRESRWTLGLNYRPAHAWVVKLDREWRRAAARTLVFGEEDAFLLSIGFIF